MAEVISGRRLSTMRLILIPAVISLAVTILRLIGELQHWSQKWFSSQTGGVMPSGVSWLIGITWLALPFGIYFAWKLRADGQGPPHQGGAVLYAALGLILMLGGLIFLIPHIPIGFPPILIFVWLIMAVAAIIQLPAWPALFKTLLVYGLASRIPVAIVMFLAMRGNWGTHYDYTGMPPQFQMDLWPKYLWLAFFPQLIFWVGFTILMGSLSGSIACAILQLRKQAPEGTRVASESEARPSS